MKNNNQIQAFLSQEKVKNEKEKTLIRAFLTCHQSSVYIVKNMIKDGGVDHIAFERWFRKGFGAGEVARYNESIVILGQCGIKSCRIVGIFNLNLGTFNSQLISVKPEELTKLKRDDERKLRKRCLEVLAKHGLQYHTSVWNIAEKYIPGHLNYVEFKNDDMNGAGIVKRFDKVGNRVEFYCYCDLDTKEVTYKSSEDMSLPVDDYEFQSVSHMSVPIIRLKKLLMGVGKKWSHDRKRVEGLKCRAIKNSTYYYLDKDFRTDRKVELNDTTDSARFKIGNYFLKKADCDEMSKKIHGLIAKFYSE